MSEVLHLPDFYYTEALKLFIIELSAIITAQAMKLESSNETEEYKVSKRRELNQGINLSSKLSNDYKDIINGEKTMDELDKFVLNSILDNLSKMKRETNSEEEILEIIDKRMAVAKKFIDETNKHI